jgi:hypothetical protein
LRAMRELDAVSARLFSAVFSQTQLRQTN